MGSSPWGRQELGMIERLHFHFSLPLAGAVAHPQPLATGLPTVPSVPAVPGVNNLTGLTFPWMESNRRYTKDRFTGESGPRAPRLAAAPALLYPSSAPGLPEAPSACYPVNSSVPGFSVHHYLPEFPQTHVH